MLDDKILIKLFVLDYASTVRPADTPPLLMLGWCHFTQHMNMQSNINDFMNILYSNIDIKTFI
jgi:hypothetical protein